MLVVLSRPLQTQLNYTGVYKCREFHCYGVCEPVNHLETLLISQQKYISPANAVHPPKAHQYPRLKRHPV